MKRKRFIKRLMGMGYSRDEARKAAEAVLQKNENIQDRNELISYWNRSCRREGCKNWVPMVAVRPVSYDYRYREIRDTRLYRIEK